MAPSISADYSWSYDSTRSYHSKSLPRPNQAVEISITEVDPLHDIDSPSSRSSVVPDGWPQRLDSPLVWDETSFATEEAFTYTLKDEEIAEIESALNYFNGLELHTREVNSSTFPIPRLRARLRALARELHYGRGFFILRGLDPQMYDPTDSIIIYLGISSHIAPQRRMQDPVGDVLVHVFNDRKMITPQEERGAKSSKRASSFHTDSACDILALQTVGLPATGGRTILASTSKIYNELAATSPELIHALAQPNWTRNDYGHERPSTESPLLYHHDERVILNFSREALVGLNPKTQQHRSLSPTQSLALDTVKALATKHSIALETQPGDLAYINNLALLHAREAFEDNPPIFCRHLVRLWLRNPEMAWRLPTETMPWYNVQDRWEREGVEENWEVEPVPRVRYRSCWFAPH